MTLSRKLLLALILVASALVPVATSQAASINISVGDRPYYTRGPFYWNNNVRYVWVPGHWSNNRRYWVRGRYVARERRNPVNALRRRHLIHRGRIFGR